MKVHTYLLIYDKDNKIFSPFIFSLIVDESKRELFPRLGPEESSGLLYHDVNMYLCRFILLYGL